MKLTNVDGENVEIQLTPGDIDSAIRAFICGCHAEYASGWVINQKSDGMLETYIATRGKSQPVASAFDGDEEELQQAIEVIRSEQRASVSLLQRRLRLGYGRAVMFMKEIEFRGFVGPEKSGGEPRDLLFQ